MKSKTKDFDKIIILTAIIVIAVVLSILLWYSIGIYTISGINVALILALSIIFAVPITLFMIIVTHKFRSNYYKRMLIVLTIAYIVILASVFIVLYYMPSEKTPGDGTPMITATIKKEGNNWTLFIEGTSRRFEEGFQYYTFVIKRGNLTLVSFTINDKQPNDPLNIDPLTGKITDENVYILIKEGYTIYFYDNGSYLDGVGVLTPADHLYIVNNGLRSGDVFEILYNRPWDHYTFTLWSNAWEGGLP